MSLKVLIIDDEPLTREVFSAACRGAGHTVIEAGTLAEGLDLSLSDNPDIILLDLVLPDASGYDMLRRFGGVRFGILVVSAKGDTADRILALELGADDFMVKPVDLRELVVRIRRIGERVAAKAETRGGRVTFGPFVLDLQRLELTVDGAPVDLTRGQFRLLELFVAHAEEPLARGEIARMLYGYEAKSDSRSIDVLVSKLRAVLGAYGGEELIRSIRGVGYLFTGRIQPVRPR